MGYYTEYDLNMMPWPCEDKEREIKANIIARIDSIDISKVEDSDIEWFLSSEMKWYHYREDMLEVSKMFPDIMFILHGEGEDHDDMWYEYYCNGETERIEAELVYPKPKNPKFARAVEGVY